MIEANSEGGRVDTSVTVVIPVKNMSRHVGACVSTFAAQLGVGDEVLVVDDGSTDDSLRRATDAGARVLANTGPAGPYGARNYGASASRTPFILFADARSRAHDGLIEAHRRLLSESGVALSCTDVRIESGLSLAGRIAAAQNSFSVVTKVRGTPLDFYPTANLGVRRTAFESVEGFRAIRSGADADLCWRIQAMELGRLAADMRVLMSWVARDKLKALLEQNYRYGQSAVLLERLHADAFARAADTAVRPSGSAVPTAVTDRAADVGARALNLAVRTGRLVGRWEHRAVTSDDASLAGRVA